MRIIGVTGPSGSGKTLLTEYLVKLGAKAINADELYHSMLIPPSPCLDAIAEAFGDGILTCSGELDRGKLSSIVFSDPDKLTLLNSTVLSIVADKIRDIIADLRSECTSAVVIDAPTLIEAGLTSDCDTVISVLAPPRLRADRIAIRDDISQQKALERINAQKSDDFYIVSSDIVLRNDGNENEFRSKLYALANELLNDQFS